MRQPARFTVKSSGPHYSGCRTAGQPTNALARGAVDLVMRIMHQTVWAIAHQRGALKRYCPECLTQQCAEPIATV